MLWASLRAFSGFAMAGLMIVMESWFSSRATNANRARLFAVYQTVFYLSTACGQLFINIGDASGSATPFAIATLLITAAVVPLSMTCMPNPPIDQAERLSLAALYRLSPVGLVAALIAGALTNAFYSMAPVYAHEIGLATRQLSLFMAAAIVAAMLLAWPVGRLCDCFNRRRVLMIVVGAAAAASFTIPFIGVGHGLLLIAATGLYMGLTAAVYPVAVAITNDQMPSQQITAASTTLLLAFGLGSCIGPIAAASAMDVFGPNGLFATNTVFLALLGVYLGYRLCVRADVPRAQRTDYVAASPDIGFGLAELDPRNEAFDAGDRPPEQGVLQQEDDSTDTDAAETAPNARRTLAVAPRRHRGRPATV